jgi:H+/gluconate symporter-like permease
LVSTLIVAVLTYGGISLFVVVFATQPILLLMFKEAGLPRKLIMGPFFAGLGTYTLGCLPGTPQLTNVIPSQYLGTPMTAAPVLSIVLALIMAVLCQIYLMWEEKQSRKRGEQFDFPAGFDKSIVEVDAASLPSSAKAFAPIVVLIIFIIVSTLAKAPYAGDPGLLTSIAMTLAIIVCLALNPKRVSITKTKDWLGEGTMQGMSAIIGLAAVIAFGAVVASTPAFQDILKWVINLKLNVYVKGVVSTAVISGITGSSSGGVRIVMQNMADYFKASGGNLEVLHRLMGVAAGSFDTLPHVSAIFLFFSMFGVTHKDSYKYVFVCTVAVPTITVIIGLIIALIVY